MLWKKWWNKGIATECLIEVIRYLLQEMWYTYNVQKTLSIYGKGEVSLNALPIDDMHRNKISDKICDTKRLKIHRGITEIKSYALLEYTELEEVEMSNTVKKIGNFAFAKCEKLKNIRISDSVNEIGTGAFLYCTSLKNIYLPDNIETIKERTFLYNEDLEEIKFSNGLKKIESRAFAECSNLNKIDLPEGIEKIEAYAFEKCTSVNEVIVPPKVHILRDHVFDECVGLEKVQLPDSIKELEHGRAFEGCNNLKEINVTLNNEMLSSVEGVLFNKDCTRLLIYPQGKEDDIYIIPNTVTHFNDLDRTFVNCTKLRGLVIPDNITEIPINFIVNCKNLEKIRIPSSVQEIYNRFLEDSKNRVIIYCDKNSYAEQFAIEHNISYVLGELDEM